MTAWWEAVGLLRTGREPGVLVTLTQVRGHAPREAGAKMVVSTGSVWGSIGGGNLEEDAVARARDLVLAGASAPLTYTASLSDKAPGRYGVQCCGGEVTVLLEPLPVVPAVAVFGMGHVGLELARILSRHEIELHLVDSRERQLSDQAMAPLADAVAAVHPHHVPIVPERVLGGLPTGTDVLVLTHDHAEDLAILDAALRCDHLGTIGVIGSSAKWTRFRSRLVAAGFAEEDLRRVVTPIGLPGLTISKDPAAIALSVAAAWLASREPQPADVGPPSASPAVRSRP